MNEVSKFIVDNWQYISIAIIVLLEIVLLIVKRFKLKLNLPTSIYEKVCKLVKEAEQTFGAGHGDEKLKYVVSRYLQEEKVPGCFYSEFSWWVKCIVEDILGTPQKKGEEDGKK